MWNFKVVYFWKVVGVAAIERTISGAADAEIWVIFMLKEQVETFPLASVAVQVTLVVPIGYLVVVWSQMTVMGPGQVPATTVETLERSIRVSLPMMLKFRSVTQLGNDGGVQAVMVLGRSILASSSW